jgi:predicted NBD/HSP70 family sugar kinase
VANGIGAGIVMKGKLVGGGSGYAGEIGHIKVDDHGPLCPRCGQRGCVETKAAERYVISQVAGRGIIEFPQEEGQGQRAHGG